MIESEDQYPFGACQAVTVDAPGAGNSNVVFAGMGGGVALVSTAAPNNPALWTGTTKNRLFTKGFVRSATIVRGGGKDHLYVAAGRRGAQGYDLANQNDSIPGFPTSNSQGDAWAVAGVTVGGERYLFVGSQSFPGTPSGSGTGTIVGYRVGTGTVVGGGPLVLPAAVYSLAVSATLASDGGGNPYVTLLAGTCAGLKRFDVPLSSFGVNGVTIPTNYVTYDPMAFGNPTLVRDIVIHESERIAYLACHGRGLHRVDLGQGAGTIVENPNDDYPILDEGGEAQMGRYVRCVALSPDTSRLVVGLGHGLEDERQVWGACSVPVSCDGAQYTLDFIPTQGLIVYSAIDAADPVPMQEASLPYIGNQKFRVHDVATREIGTGGTSFYIDCAFNALGYQLVRFDTAPTPSLTAFGSFADDTDGNLLGSVDDVLVHQHPNGTRAVYAATEHGLAALPLPPPVPGVNEFEAAMPPTAKAGAVWLASPRSPLSQEWIVGCNLQDVRFYKLTPNPLEPTVVGGPLVTGGRYSVGARLLQAPAAAAGESWMLIPMLKFLGLGSTAGSAWGGSAIHLYDVAGVLNGSVTDPATLVPKITYVDEVPPWPPGETTPKNRQLLDLHAVTVDIDRQALYVNYGPGFGVRNPDGSLVAEGENAVGLVVLEAKRQSNGARPYSIAMVNKVVASSGLHNPCEPGRVTVSGTTLAAAYGCNGSALFDLGGSDPFAPTLIAYRSSEGRSTLQAGLTPSGRAYVCYLDGTIDVMLVSEFACPYDGPPCVTPSLQRFRTPFQPNQITRDPQTGDLYLADGGGGVYRIALP